MDIVHIPTYLHTIQKLVNYIKENEVDLKNIEDELNRRKSEPKFENGGTLSFHALTSAKTEDLEKMVKELKDFKTSEANKKLKDIVSEIFLKFGDSEDNMIVLSAANVPERRICASYDPFKSIDFSRYTYNKLYHTVCSDWETSDKRWKDYVVYKQKLLSLAKEAEIGTAEEIFEDDDDALNEYWYGVVGIMKDFRVVSFVIRDDGMLCNRDGYETFHNHVLETL